MTGAAFPARWDSVRWWARLDPQRIALVDRARDARISYAALDQAADRWAALLAEQGVGAGDRVALACGTRTEAVALLFACGRLGALLVPLNWRLAAAELAPVLADAAPALLIGEARWRETTESAARASIGTAARWVDLDADAPRMLARVGDDTRTRAVRAEDPWLVLYTSGSTGRPKGAVLTHRQLFYNAVATITGWELSSADVAPVSTPLFHTGGWNVFLTPLLHAGGRAVLLDGFAPDEFMAAMADERCTMALTVPTQLVMLRECAAWGRELPHLRTFMSGGAPLPGALFEQVRAAGYRVREGYGLTECGPNCFASSVAHAVTRAGSVGWPMPFLEMRVAVGEAEREAEPDEPGELLLRGPQVFGGYLNAPERTTEVLDADGWLRTGDLVRRAADGSYSVCGRKKEMFISGGENVYPAEVEAALADLAAVAEAVVVGVPDERWGEVGRAFVVARPGMMLTEAQVLAHAAARLARYKVPKSVALVDALPRLGSGKPDRRALAAARA